MSAHPDPTGPNESELAKRLLEYDAALAAGNVPAALIDNQLPDDFRESFSCLEMLESLRLSDCISSALNPLPAEIPRAPSISYAPSVHLGLGTNEESQVPAQLGRFQILNLLGQGGCGVVFLARDPALNRQVAIKVPRPEALLTPELRQRFVQEGRAAASLDHPNITAVFEAGEIGAICYLASAYCPGITLREWLGQRRGAVPPRAAASLVATLAGAMDYAHRKGVCHRDLKPSNILLQRGESREEKVENRTQNPAKGGVTPALPTEYRLPITDDCLLTTSPKIIDFGLAKVICNDGNEARTRSGAVFGTPRYMAPEQAQGHTQAVGPATDIHALGVILYELLTGQPPYQGDTDLKILSQVVAGEPKNPSRLCLDLPRDLETICLKCLEKQPQNRYGSMRELEHDLHRFLDGRPVQARRIGWAARAAKWIRRRPRATAVGAITGVLLFSLVAVLIWISGRESTHSADMKEALREIGSQKALAGERDLLARNQEYAAQIRAGGDIENEDQLPMLRDLLLAQKPGSDQNDLRGFEWHYLWRFGQGFLVPQEQARVTTIAYSESGDICASGNLNGMIHVFDRRTGKSLARLQGHTFAVNRLYFLEDDTQLLSTAFVENREGSGFRSEFILWKLGGENKVLRRGDYSYTGKVFGHPNFAIAPAAQVLFIIEREGTQHRLLKLDLQTGTQRTLMTSDHLDLAAATFHADRVALILNQETVNIFDPGTMRQISSCRFSKKPVHMAEFSPDGKVLALGVGWYEGSRCVEIREAESLRLLKSFEFALLPLGLRLDRQGKRLAVGTGHTHFHIFEVETGDSLGSFKDEGAQSMAVAFAPDGEEMATGSRNGRVRTGKNVFDPKEYSLPGPLPTSEAWCVAFSPDGSTLAAGYDHPNVSEHQTLRLWDLTTKKARSLPGHDATVMALAVSPDGKTLATASYDRTARLWEMASGKCLQELRGHTDAVRALAFSPDGQQVASAGSDLSIKTWNVKNGSLQSNRTGHKDTIRSLAFSPGSELLISAANDSTIKIWNDKDGTFVRAIADESKVQSVACSPDGSLLASGNENSRVELWQLGTGALWKSLPGHSGKIRCVAFSPDGKTLASGGEDGTVRLWNVITGQEMLVLPTEHIVNGLAFHPHKPLLAAALHDGTVKIWSGE
jgi:WD40 repeat protein